MSSRFSEPWQDPVWLERARIAARAIGNCSFTPTDVVPVVARAIGCKAPSAVASALIVAEDTCLVSYSVATGLWSRAKRVRAKRVLTGAWSGYVSPSETGVLLENYNGSVVLTTAAAPRPLRHFMRTKREVAQE